jgi:hypothetical protein
MAAAEYWVMDDGGLVLGPVGLQVLRDIAAGTQLGHRSKASTDGRTWVPLMDLPEVARAVLPPAMQERQERDLKEAARLVRELERIRDMPAHVLFGVPPGATARAHREGFLALAAPYHPARLPHSVHPDLLRACMALFQFLSGRMVEVDREEKARQAALGLAAPGQPSPGQPARAQPGAPPPARTPTPAPGALRAVPAPPASARTPVPEALRAVPPAPSAPSAPPAPAAGNDDQEALMGLVPLGDDRLQAHVRVTPGNCDMFSAHRLVNLSSSGAFVPCSRPPPLGSLLLVTFHFAEPPPRQVRTRGRVLMENVVRGRDRVGFGMRFDDLSADDRAYIQGYVQRAAGGRR